MFLFGLKYASSAAMQAVIFFLSSSVRLRLREICTEQSVARRILASFVKASSNFVIFPLLAKELPVFLNYF